jgi:hypothetical protein
MTKTFLKLSATRQAERRCDQEQDHRGNMRLRCTDSMEVNRAVAAVRVAEIVFSALAT